MGGKERVRETGSCVSLCGSECVCVCTHVCMHVCVHGCLAGKESSQAKPCFQHHHKET